MSFSVNLTVSCAAPGGRQTSVSLVDTYSEVEIPPVPSLSLSSLLPALPPTGEISIRKPLGDGREAANKTSKPEQGKKRKRAEVEVEGEGDGEGGEGKERKKEKKEEEQENEKKDAGEGAKAPLRNFFSAPGFRKPPVPVVDLTDEVIDLTGDD